MPDAVKAALRARLTAARRAIPPVERQERSNAIAGRVASLPAFGVARVVALYAPVGAEVDTAALARLARAAGKEILWPRLSAEARRLEFAACAPEALVDGPLSTRQPPPGAPAQAPGRIDLICVPGVGFDPALRRLGRGGGYYDATLPLLGGRALRVGLAFDLQVVAELPAGPLDAPVDLVATETRLLGPAPLAPPG
jgi:5-formyltetrahydrofolate cyclo-ligase